MYCPICFNDTLKPASSGIIKLTFNGKSKSTSQFYYNTKEETIEDFYLKLTNVVEDYFKYYSSFQNKDIIKDIAVFSNDFICSKGCKLNISHKMQILDVLLAKERVFAIVQAVGLKTGLQVELD